jgi:hypothetical protein
VIAVPLRLRFGLEDRENNELAPTINLASTALAGQIQESTEPFSVTSVLSVRNKEAVRQTP